MSCATPQPFKGLGGYVVDYLALRRVLGFELGLVGLLLDQFVAYLDDGDRHILDRLRSAVGDAAGGWKPGLACVAPICGSRGFGEGCPELRGLEWWSSASVLPEDRLRLLMPVPRRRTIEHSDTGTFDVAHCDEFEERVPARRRPDRTKGVQRCSIDA